MDIEQMRFVDITGQPAHVPEPWPAMVVRGPDIAREIERLADLERPANGRRAASIVHPMSRAPGLGLAPGIDVVINVLKPEGSTVPMRRNSNQVEICIQGSGKVCAGASDIRFGKWDVWNIPSMQTYAHVNDGDGLMVRLSYSNAPLLEKMEIHYMEENPSIPAGHGAAAAGDGDDARQSLKYARENAPNIQITPEGAWMRGYEYLVDIEVVENKALHWPWELTSRHVPIKPGDNQRGIMLLYNPATERRNGTTHSFFATIAATPPNAPPRTNPRGHRHSSAAINYWLQGSGHSIVAGERIDWEAGDLMLSGPGWAEHAHYPGRGGQAVLTVQDHPLQIGMESLIWQEEMTGAILTLGSEAGVTGFTGPRQRGA